MPPTAPTRSTAAVVAAQGIDLEAARAQRAATIPARRYGTPEEFGAACAFLCSVHAGFIVGQNWLLDGGRFRGRFEGQDLLEPQCVILLNHGFSECSG